MPEDSNNSFELCILCILFVGLLRNVLKIHVPTDFPKINTYLFPSKGECRIYVVRKPMARVAIKDK